MLLILCRTNRHQAALCLRIKRSGKVKQRKWRTREVAYPVCLPAVMQTLYSSNPFCNPECIPNCIPIGSAKVSPTVCATASLQPPGECPIATHRSPLGPVGVREPLGAQQNILNRRRGAQGPPGGGGSCWVMPRTIWGLRVIDTDNVQPVDRV